MTTRVDDFIERAAALIREHAEELTALDQAIGDGDHGINMKRGFEAVEAARADLNELSPGAALQKIGMTLVMKVGGASGPLYGSLFMALGKRLGESPDPAAFAAACRAGVEAVQQRGKAQAGDKTMLDVLLPAAEALEQAVAAGEDTASLCRRLPTLADECLEWTRDLLARKGRASYLGERSIGHLDPGARSSALLIRAACNSLEDLS